MKRPNTVEDELNVIRLAIYEETKDMSIKERVAYLRAEAEAVHKEFGIRSHEGMDSMKMTGGEV
jgi:hypothetical protein